MKSKTIFLLIHTCSVLLLVLLDQHSKSLFTYKDIPTSFFLSIQYHENTGSALGLFGSLPYYNELLIFLSLLVLGFFLFFYRKEQSSNYQIVHLLIISGVLGNLLDRILLGYVRDFISLDPLFIFNFADVYLTLAVCFLLVIEFSNDKDLKK